MFSKNNVTRRTIDQIHSSLRSRLLGCAYSWSSIRTRWCTRAQQGLLLSDHFDRAIIAQDQGTFMCDELNAKTGSPRRRILPHRDDAPNVLVDSARSRRDARCGQSMVGNTLGEEDVSERPRSSTASVSSGD